MIVSFKYHLWISWPVVGSCDVRKQPSLMSVREALHHEIVCYCRVNEHVSNITVVIPEYSSMLLDREKHPMQEEMSRDFKLHR